MMTLENALAVVQGKREKEYGYLRSYIASECPDTMKALRLIDAECLAARRRRGYNLVKRESRRFGFLYYVRYSHQGRTLPTKWNTGTNDEAEAGRFAVRNRERLVGEYLRRRDGEMYDFFEKFYGEGSDYLACEEKRNRAIGETQRKMYGAVMKTKFVPFLRERGVRVFEEVTVETLSDFQDSLLARGLKPQSVNNDLKAVRKAFRYLARKGMIKGNPCPGLQSVTVLRKDQTVRGCYEVKDLKGVFDAPWEDEGAYPLNLLVYTTGMRNGEIRRMRTGDIVERGGCHFIDIRESKTPSGVRLVPLHERVRERLLSYARDKSPDEAVFPCCKSSPRFGKAAVMLGQRLGVSEEELGARHITFYSGRHFWKTLMNCGGLGEEAEEFFMGHKVSGDAAKRYNHRDRQGKDLMARKAGKAFAILGRYLFGS